MRATEYAVIVLGLVLVACVNDPGREKVFSDAWTYHMNRADEIAARKQRLRGDEELILMGKEGKSRTAVYLDEKGRPRLNVGRKKGLSADLDLDTDEAEVKVKYKCGWKPKPERE